MPPFVCVVAPSFNAARFRRIYVADNNADAAPARRWINAQILAVRSIYLSLGQRPQEYVSFY